MAPSRSRLSDRACIAQKGDSGNIKAFFVYRINCINFLCYTKGFHVFTTVVRHVRVMLQSY